MSTRSWIACVNKDDTVDYIYCHFDGYLEGVGKILKEHYTRRKKVMDLLYLGDISSLEEDVESCPAYNISRETANSVEELIRNFKDSGTISYLYIYGKNGGWTAYYTDICKKKL